MSTEQETTVSIPKLRTYAEDLARVRALKKGEPVPEKRKFVATLTNTQPASASPVPSKADLQAAAAAVKDIPPPPAPKAKKPIEAKRSAAAPTLSSIPSFHELKKHGRKHQTGPHITDEDLKKLDKPERESLLEKRSKTVDLDDDTEQVSGTVITDTKRDRFKFFPALFASMLEWLRSAKKTYIDDRKPVYTVSDTRKRAKVIRNAATKTGRDEVVDHRVVVERLKQRSGTEAISADASKTDEALHPEWRHVTNKQGDKVLLLDDGEDEPIIPPPPAPTPVPAPVAIPEAPPTPAPEPEVEVDAPKEVAPEPEPVELPEPEEPALPEEEEEVEEPNASRGQLIPDRAAWIKNVEDTNTLSLGIVATVALIIALVVTGRFVYLTFFVTPETDAVVTESTLLTNLTSEPIVLTSETTPSLFIQSALANIRQTTDTTALYHAVTESGTPVDGPALTIRMLGLAADPALVRTTKRAAVGGQNTRPFIILEIENRDTALASMLEWESSLHTDLAPLFGNELLEVTIEDRITGFTDVTFSGHDTRVLYDASNVERLIYGFVGDTLIITTTPTTFAGVAERVQ